jgi:aryl-alcohol dehydrogenase-like predicted oxidoreductase
MKQPKFVLGTANLGTTYGINNPDTYDRNTSEGILKHAIARGINTFDTAAEYGLAEILIGESSRTNDNLNVITKVPTRESYTYEYVRNCLEDSLHKLQQNGIYGLMFHDPDIHKKKEIQEISKKLLGSEKLEHIGFSAYELDAVLRAKDKNPNWTIFQIPENILDQRLNKSTELVDLANDNNSLFIRSIFLQGLILLKPNDLPYKFQKFGNIFHELQLAGDQMGMSVLDLCLSYASSITWSSGTIVSAASTAQLDQILDYKFVEMDFDKFARLPDDVLDPRRWGEIG